MAGASHQEQKYPVNTNMANPGSTSDLSKDLLKEVEELESLFTIDTAKLKAITEHFRNELKRGLSVEGGTIVSYGHTDVAWLY